MSRTSSHTPLPSAAGVRLAGALVAGAVTAAAPLASTINLVAGIAAG